MAALRCFEHSILFLGMFYVFVLHIFTKSRFFRFFLQNPLTNLVQSAIICKSPARRADITNPPQKTLKKVEKTFEKGIDKWKRMWYNTEVAAKAVAEMILEN